mgnify:FL=1
MRKSSAIGVATSLIVFTLSAAWAVAETNSDGADLKAAPANTWIKIYEAETGGREQPIFVYAEVIKKFVISTGMQAYGGNVPRHYDTEEFDLATRRWINAYPAGVAEGRPDSGPVGEEYSRQRARQGYDGPQLFYQDGDHLRVGAGGQWTKTKTYGEYCYVQDSGKIYAYIWDKTLCYDVKQRTWTDLKTEPRTACRIWGSMCYDPVNKEILHAGGDGGSTEVSTWVYNIAKNEWHKLSFGSDEFNALFARAKQLRWRAKDLAGRAASRHAVAENDEESKVDLSALASKLNIVAKQFSAEVEQYEHEAQASEQNRESKVDTHSLARRACIKVAIQRLKRASGALNEVTPVLSKPITPETIASVRAIRVVFDQVVDALSPEPPGRARSQIAYDAVHQKIVLFGGDGLDRTLSDTWVYDCKTRKWEQRFPAECPAPRAGHILAWLPKSQQIVLAGGYSRVPLAQEVWVYDVGDNNWKLLLHVPLEGSRNNRYSRNCPRVTDREFQFGAVNEDDVLVCPNGTTVWACKIDTDKPLTQPERVSVRFPAQPKPGANAPRLTGERVGTSGSYVFNRIDPATWENAAQPESQKSQAFLDKLPANQWTTFDFPMYAPGARNRWGTTAYDTDRHQFLFWGGGHATSHENDVAHFSLRGSRWTIGYHPDDPIEKVYATQPTPISFQDRVHVPIHAYKAYCYDPTARKMFYFDRAYNPSVRDWEPTPFAGLEHRGPMHSQMESTPHGAVTYSEKGLFRFDAKNIRWKKLPWDGPPFGRIWCDGHCLCYDSRRDCLWFANDKSIVRYDMSTGKAELLEVQKKPRRSASGCYGASRFTCPTPT